MAPGTTLTAPREAGSPAADFTLRATDGGVYASKAARENGSLLIVLFKVGCGTCKYSVPFLQRFHEQYALPSGGRFQVWGISQDTVEDTLAFARENGGATFPLLLDDKLEVTLKYGLTNVPDLYLLSKEATISAAVLGSFSVEGFNALARTVAAMLGVPYVPIVRDEDNAPATKPG